MKLFFIYFIINIVHIVFTFSSSSILACSSHFSPSSSQWKHYESQMQFHVDYKNNINQNLASFRQLFVCMCPFSRVNPVVCPGSCRHPVVMDRVKWQPGYRSQRRWTSAQKVTRNSFVTCQEDISATFYHKYINK